MTPPITSGTLSILVDEDQEILRIVGTGTWSPAYIDAHFAELRSHIDAMRRNGQPVLVLVDLTRADVQPTATAERIKVNTGSIYRPGDRVAAVVGSSLAKIQIRNTVDRSYHELFVSVNAAFTWLMAYRMAASGRRAS